MGRPGPALVRRDGYFLLAHLGLVLVFFQFIATLPLYIVQDLGLSEAVYGLVFTVNTVLVSLSIRHVGPRVAQLLTKEYPTAQKLTDATVEAADGVGLRGLCCRHFCARRVVRSGLCFFQPPVPDDRALAWAHRRGCCDLRGSDSQQS